MIHLMNHPNGPVLPASALKLRFTSTVDLAIWAEKNIPHGVYLVKRTCTKVMELNVSAENTVLSSTVSIK